MQRGEPTSTPKHSSINARKVTNVILGNSGQQSKVGSTQLGVCLQGDVVLKAMEEQG